MDDNRLLSEFVIMCHRSNNAIFKHLVLSWPYGYRMVFAIIWKDTSNVFIFASTNSDQIVLRAVGALYKIQMESSENYSILRAFSLVWGCSENYINLALAGFFAIKKSVLRQAIWLTLFN